MARHSLRRTVIVALALIVLGLPPQARGALAPGTVTPDRAGWTRIWTRANTVSVSVPHDWKTTVGTEGSSVVATAPGGMPQVTVAAEQVGPSVTADEYAAQHARTLRTALPAAHALQAETGLRIAGIDAHPTVLEWPVNGKDYAVLQAAIVSGGIGVVATATWDRAAASEASAAQQVIATLELGAASSGQMPSAPARPLAGRRNLFASPPGAVSVSADVSPRRGAAGTSASVPLPPMPIPDATGPSVPPDRLPGLLPALPSATRGTNSPAAPSPPAVALRGIVLGSTPQAVLMAGTSYTIVTFGQHTAWGMVRGITATTVTLETDTGFRTLTIGARPQPTATTEGGS